MQFFYRIWRQRLITRIILASASIFFFFNRFKPDIFLNEGDDLSVYGFDAKALHLPGHSKGHISILTADGDLFCGDLLINIHKPVIITYVDDPAELNDSVERVKSLGVNTVYPGHGRPFPMEKFINN